MPRVGGAPRRSRGRKTRGQTVDRESVYGKSPLLLVKEIVDTQRIISDLVAFHLFRAVNAHKPFTVNVFGPCQPLKQMAAFG